MPYICFALPSINIPYICLPYIKLFPYMSNFVARIVKIITLQMPYICFALPSINIPSIGLPYTKLFPSIVVRIVRIITYKNLLWGHSWIFPQHQVLFHSYNHTRSHVTTLAPILGWLGLYKVICQKCEIHIRPGGKSTSTMKSPDD